MTNTKTLRIIHLTQYNYFQPVSFGTHYAMMRPREGHNVRIVKSNVELEPSASVRWRDDIENNSVAIIDFEQPATRLRLLTEIDVELNDDIPFECLIDPSAKHYPFQYSPEEQVSLVPYRIPSYPYEGPELHRWLSDLYQPGQSVETFDLLNRLNTHIFDSLKYTMRFDHGVQLPHETISLGSGSCRDYAVLMMEAARFWGFGARFVTGYIQMSEGQHGATHAWTEIYVPGAGWHGFDPTNNKRVGAEHIAVGVSREQEQAAPLKGSWSGPSNAFKGMEVSVQVVEV
ncbi:Transglutaminase-like superfamily protein [Rubripirellula obstinata]|uniref:Transglutaminase-like superfamily protein n=1 Tax=Rubripirellula obstinata TaxID=406547 RepID=A0A5B1CGH3_9BACT|nr:transglutaminase family protein [Rubripirellula obstinata]KAA1260288.1 Transglutaminase-like superfamily protein [Rubripirellula obstinata]